MAGGVAATELREGRSIAAAVLSPFHGPALAPACDRPYQHCARGPRRRYRGEAARIYLRGFYGRVSHADYIVHVDAEDDDSVLDAA